MTASNDQATAPDATESFEIRNRWSGKVQFTAPIEIGLSFNAKIGAAVRRAFESDADLSGAVLHDADLSGADLRDADLRDADLRGAEFRRADLRRADLRRADLRRAILRGGDLRRAVLGGAILRGADLRGADLSGAVLGGAVLGDADLSGVILDDALLVPNIDAKILAVIEAGGTLDMGAWHRCETTHCRAGWAITLAGEAGAALENAMGSAAAGALIYAVSTPDEPVPNFYASNEDAMADLRERASRQGAPA